MDVTKTLAFRLISAGVAAVVILTPQFSFFFKIILLY